MLIIGRRKPREGDDFGGVVVLYELFLDYFENKGIKYEDIDLNWRNYSNKIVFLLVIYLKIAKAILSFNHQKISFHATTTDFTYYAPFTVFLGKIFRKRVTIRMFGGNFDKYYNNLNGIRKLIVTYALKNASSIFFETKFLVEKFSKINETVWFPNVRNVKTKRKTNKTYERKFVFISHVKKSKGVNLILKVLQKLPRNYTVHIFGPKQNYSPPQRLEEIFQSHYKGVLQPEEVLDAMGNYDVLLLPTFHEGEGYPGAILEAYSQSMPVISTRWQSIPEIVEDGETGYLIAPRSVQELSKAMQSINSKNYPGLSKSALNYFDNFQQDKVMERILENL